MSTATEVVPDIRFIAIDETNLLTNVPEIVKHQVVYGYDAARATYLCEILPSYELHPLYMRNTYADDVSDERRDEIEGDLLGNSFEEPIYRHVSRIDALANANPDNAARRHGSDDDRGFDANSDDRATGYGTFLERALEHARCNASI